MTQVTVLDKYRITIPKEIREHLKLRKGRKMLVEERNGIVRFYPVWEDDRPAGELTSDR